jgi:ABC-type Fe3+/spermidine/putrescine transport system ATPase subunit
MIMSDRIAVMNEGAVAQLGTAEEIYASPANRFVAGFVGKINLLPAQQIGVNGKRAVVQAGGGQFITRTSTTTHNSAKLVAAIRPEHLQFDRLDHDCNSLTGVVVARTFSGNLVHSVVRLVNGDELTVETRPTDDIPSEGAQATVSWKPEQTLLLVDE